MIIDWTAAVFTLIGIGFLAFKNKYGFILAGISSILWTLAGIIGPTKSLILSSIPCMIFNFYGYWRWCKDEKK